MTQSLTREAILAMPAGDEMNALICALAEPKPPEDKTYDQLHREDAAKPYGGGYSCWDVHSPGGWWKIGIDWGDVTRARATNECPEWEPARHPSTSIRWAMKVAKRRSRKMNSGFGLAFHPEVRFANGSHEPANWEAYFAAREAGIAATDSLALCRAILLAYLGD